MIELGRVRPLEEELFTEETYRNFYTNPSQELLAIYFVLQPVTDFFLLHQTQVLPLSFPVGKEGKKSPLVLRLKGTL